MSNNDFHEMDVSDYEREASEYEAKIEALEAKVKLLEREIKHHMQGDTQNITTFLGKDPKYYLALEEKNKELEELVISTGKALFSITQWFESLQKSQDKNIEEKGIYSKFSEWDDSEVKSFDLNEVMKALDQIPAYLKERVK